MDIKKLLDGLSRIKIGLVTATIDGERIFPYLEAAQETIEKLRWIPVSERLPSNGEIVYVTVKRGYVEAGYYDEAREEWWKVDDEGLLDVIAWFPSPEPYHV